MDSDRNHAQSYNMFYTFILHGSKPYIEGRLLLTLNRSDVLQPSSPHFGKNIAVYMNRNKKVTNNSLCYILLRLISFPAFKLI